MATKKGYSTQSLVNIYPGWANIRKDEQSLGYQLLNSIGLTFDDLRKQNIRINDNYFLPTSIISDIDVYYRLKLPGDFVFTKADDDNTQYTYTPPTVSGYIADSGYNVAIAANNDIESFWYTPAPDRVSLNTTASGEFVLASGTVENSPFTASVSSGILHSPNNITITIDDATSCLGLYDNNTIRKSIVQVEGYTRQGSKVTEELIFLHNDTIKTSHEFESVVDSGLRVYGVHDTDTAQIKFTSANFKEPMYPSAYDIGSSVSGDDMPLFWGLGSVSGINTLDLYRYDVDKLELRIEGFTTKHTILSQELVDLSDNNIQPLDLAIEPRSNNIWVNSSSHIYLYTANLPFPDLSILKKKNYEAYSVIEPNTYYATLGEEIELDYVWRRPTLGMVAHRVWVEKPDGTKKSLINGSETTYSTSSDSWIYGEPKKRSIRPAEFYTLDQYGSWIFSMETWYTDGSKTIDQRLIYVNKQTARAEFNISSLIGENLQGIDFDSEYKMWVLGESGWMYQIDLHYDLMLIDFNKKILYFREPYDQTRVL